MRTMTISGLARAAAVGVETVRYYQRRGLLPVPERGADAGVRHYNQEDARRLRFIRSAQAAGFTLGEIAVLLGLDAAADRATARKMALARVEALDLKIDELSRARDLLLQLASRCDAAAAGPCPVLTAFEPEPEPMGTAGARQPAMRGAAAAPAQGAARP